MCAIFRKEKLLSLEKTDALDFPFSDNYSGISAAYWYNHSKYKSSDYIPDRRKDFSGWFDRNKYNILVELFFPSKNLDQAAWNKRLISTKQNYFTVLYKSKTYGLSVFSMNLASSISVNLSLSHNFLDVFSKNPIKSRRRLM